MKEKVFKIMSTIFDLPLETLNEESSPDNIESWDSIKQMNLVLALEEEFDVQFDIEQIADMMNAELILSILEEATKD